MTKIEWAERTWNPITGCTRVSEGSDLCYMHRLYPWLKSTGNAGYRLEADMVEEMPARADEPPRLEEAEADIRMLNVGLLPQGREPQVSGPASST